MDEIDFLLKSVSKLTAEVERDAGRLMDGWRDRMDRKVFLNSADNLAHYLALRPHDIRPLQRKLARFGFSSLGRLEGRVAPTLTLHATSTAAQ